MLVPFQWPVRDSKTHTPFSSRDLGGTSTTQRTVLRPLQVLLFCFDHLPSWHKEDKTTKTKLTPLLWASQLICKKTANINVFIKPQVLFLFLTLQKQVLSWYDVAMLEVREGFVSCVFIDGRAPIFTQSALQVVWDSCHPSCLDLTRILLWLDYILRVIIWLCCIWGPMALRCNNKHHSASLQVASVWHT